MLIKRLVKENNQPKKLLTHWFGSGVFLMPFTARSFLIVFCLYFFMIIALFA